MKIFVILSRVPFPLDKGDKLRAYHQIKELSKSHTIYLCCLDDNNTPQKDIDHLNEFCEEVTVIKLRKWQSILNLGIGLFSSLPFQVWYFYQRHAHNQVKNLITAYQPDHIYCQLIRVAEYVKNEHSIPKTLDYMDTFSKGIERRIDGSGMLKPLFKSENQRLIKYENLIFEYFENKTIISDQDLNFILHQNREQIKIIPNGIDLDFFKPMESEKEYDLVFVGNMSYAPNVESAIFIVKKILPILLKQNPNIKVLLSGASPAKNVLDLASENVTVSGWVEDIRHSYSKGKIFIAPLNIGTGLQNKLLEAMAMEIPCITSTLANNALKAVHNKHVLIGNSPDEYANLVLELLNNDDKRNKLAKEGKNYIEQNFSWKNSTKILKCTIEDTKL